MKLRYNSLFILKISGRIIFIVIGSSRSLFFLHNNSLFNLDFFPHSKLKLVIRQEKNPNL